MIGGRGPRPLHNPDAQAPEPRRVRSNDQTRRVQSSPASPTPVRRCTVSELARQLRARGWWVGMVPMITPEALTLELEEAGVAWATLGMERGSAHPRDVARLRRILREWRPSVVHSHMIHAEPTRPRRPDRDPHARAPVHGPQRRRGRGRRGCWRIGSPIHSAIARRTSALRRSSATSASAPCHGARSASCPTASTRKSSGPARSCGPRSVMSSVWATSSSGSGLDDSRSRRTTRPCCGPSTEVLGRCPHNRLLLVGEGALQEELIREHALLGFGDAVRFLGVGADVADVLNAADAYLMSSALGGNADRAARGGGDRTPDRRDRRRRQPRGGSPRRERPAR